jgi:Fe-S-cluster containining protein
VERIARFLGYKPRRFKRAWKRREDGIYWVPDKPCMFLDGNKCSIYPVRMVVCKYCPMRRVSIQGQECIAVSGYCNAGAECIKWLRDKADG